MRAWFIAALTLMVGVACAGKSRDFDDEAASGGGAGEQGGSSGNAGGSSGSTTGGSSGTSTGGSSGTSAGGDAGASTGGASAGSSAGSGLGGDAGTSAGGSARGGGSASGGGAGMGAEDCNDERRALRELINANKSCNETADCGGASIGCGVSEDGCTGAVYTNRNVDPAEFQSLLERFRECLRLHENTLGCAICDRVETPPTCRGGLCVGRTDCALEIAALGDFKSRNDACEVDDDCITEIIGCEVTEDDCTGAVYFSKDVDREELTLLRDEYYACTGGCGACRRIASPPACVSGHCVIRPLR